MMTRSSKFFLAVIAAVFVGLATQAEDVARIHVDISKVKVSADLQPVDGITSSGQPNADQFALVAAAGYVAIIDLRGAEEGRGMDEAAVLGELNIEYVTLPLIGAEAINMENAAKLDRILAGYDGPVLVHCGSGNRVGAVLALRESLRGANDAEALVFGKAAGLTGLESVVKERLAAN